MLAAFTGANASERVVPEIPPTYPPLEDILSVDTILFLRGVDLWRGGFSLHGGLIVSADGFDNGGFTFKHVAYGGSFRYRTTATGPVRGFQIGDSVSAGWQFKGNRYDITALAGFDVQYRWTTPHDPNASFNGRWIGARASIDAWWEPTDTLMTTASASLSAIGPNYATRAAVGWRLFNTAWFGPELMVTGERDYRQTRYGLHMTAFKTWVFEWSLGAGWASDNADTAGPYTRFGMLMRY